jgi:hypothetical protein
MNDFTFRYLVAISCCVPLACSTDPPPSEMGADEVGTTDSSDMLETEESSDESSDQSGSSDSTSSSESSGSTDSTDGTEESTDSETTTNEPPPDLPPLDPNENIPPLDEDGCPGIFAQDLFPTFELTIDPEVWDMLVWEWLNGPELDEMDLETSPKHPLAEFKYDDIVIHTATIRLRGNATHWDADDKMQFHIDFNDVDPDGHFLGLTKLAFDAATGNRHGLRDRLALYILRDMGITASCANNARVNVNGEYYGLFTSLEKLDKRFLERVFEDPEGDLWDRHGWELKTNEMTGTNDRLEALKDASTQSEMEEYLDVAQMLRVFAGEAILPDSDGMWAGGLNYFLYDDPSTGKFVMLPWDKDGTFERFGSSQDFPLHPDPINWERVTSHGRPWYDLALEDSDWFDYYIAAIEDQFYSSYVPEELHGLVDEWTDQIKDAMLEDENKPYSDAAYLDAVENLHDFIDVHHEFMEDWLWCWQSGGEPDPENYCVIY